VYPLAAVSLSDLSHLLTAYTSTHARVSNHGHLVHPRSVHLLATPAHCYGFCEGALLSVESKAIEGVVVYSIEA
jgi:hypothetical protein